MVTSLPLVFTALENPGMEDRDGSILLPYIVAGSCGYEPVATHGKSTRFSKSRDREPIPTANRNGQPGIVPTEPWCVNMYTKDFWSWAIKWVRSSDRIRKTRPARG
jgi:hypothetical protein